MTTASRPTFDTARGGRDKGELSSLSKQYSSRDLPSHTKLKHRQQGQGTSEEVRGKDFRRELEDKEKSAREKRDKERISKFFGGASSSSDGPSSHTSSSSKRARLDQLPASNLDADDPVDEDDDDDADSEDDTAELLAELQRIKKERMQEAARKEAEKKAEEERIRMENIIKGNPLLNAAEVKSDFKVKRRWDDDVVFKNCARGDEGKKEYINDVLRSEFHRKFLTKYIK